jgi:PAS domain S-box-containing protein
MRILIAEDRPEDVELIEKQLVSAGFVFEAAYAADADEFTRLVEKERFDVILVDFDIGGIDAYGMMDIVRRRSPRTPVVVVTGSRSEEVAVECMKKGASDYVLKHGLKRLGAAVSGALQKQRYKDERDRAFRALRENAELLHRLSDVTFDGIMIHDAGRVLEITPRFAALFGCTIPEIVGKSCMRLFSADDGEKLHDIMFCGQPGPCEISGLKKDGTVFPVEVHSQRIQYKGKEVYLTSIRDISDKKQNEKELIDKNNFLMDVLESLSHPFYVIDTETYNIVLANSAAREVGVRKGGICYQQTHNSEEPCGEKCGCPLYEVKRTGKPVVLEHEHTDRKGETRYVEVHAYPVFDDGGRVAQMIEYSLDITEKKKIVKLKEEFVNTVSHELRNPLAVIEQTLYLLDHTEGDTVSREDVRTMKILGRNVERLEMLVNDILDYQKLSVGRMDFARQKTDLQGLIREAVENMSPLAHKKGLKMAVSCGPDIPDMYIDASWITQVITNLLSNAIKFTDEGHIEVSCRREDGRAAVSVSDTGRGIREKDLKYLFQSFVQIHDENAPKEKGTGLGLVICKKVIEHHGGEITARSEYGRGSTFTFTLPLRGGTDR